MADELHDLGYDGHATSTSARSRRGAGGADAVTTVPGLVYETAGAAHVRSVVEALRG